MYMLTLLNMKDYFTGESFMKLETAIRKIHQNSIQGVDFSLIKYNTNALSSIIKDTCLNSPEAIDYTHLLLTKNMIAILIDSKNLTIDTMLLYKELTKRYSEQLVNKMINVTLKGISSNFDFKPTESSNQSKNQTQLNPQKSTLKSSSHSFDSFKNRRIENNSIYTKLIKETNVSLQELKNLKSKLLLESDLITKNIISFRDMTEKDKLTTYQKTTVDEIKTITKLIDKNKLTPDKPKTTKTPPVEKKKTDTDNSVILRIIHEIPNLKMTLDILKIYPIEKKGIFKKVLRLPVKYSVKVQNVSIKNINTVSIIIHYNIYTYESGFSQSSTYFYPVQLTKVKFNEPIYPSKSDQTEILDYVEVDYEKILSFNIQVEVKTRTFSSSYTETFKINNPLFK